MRARARFWTTSVATGALLLGLSGCGLIGGSGGSDAAGVGGVDPAAVVQASPGATVAPLKVLASRSNTSDHAVQVDVNSVQVGPKFTRVLFTLWNTSEAEGDSFSIGTMLSDGVAQMDIESPQYAGQDANSVDGVYLLDTANAKRYLAARNPAGACVCSDDLGNFVRPGKGVVLWALYQPLPAGVTSIDVSVPQVGLFENIPVTR